MKAVVVHGPADLRVEETPDPEAGPDDVIVEMEWGGVCGSDVAYYRHGTSGTAVLRDPLILGHEGAGRVHAVGERAAEALRQSSLEVGSRVTMHPATLVGDGPMPADTAGRTNLWSQVRYFGSAAFRPHEPGLFSGFRAVRPDQLRAVPDGVTTRQAALAEPLGVALHAVNRTGGVRGRTVLVNGCGPIGSLVVACARALGAAHVHAADVSSTALDIAGRMGADTTHNVGAGDCLPRDVDVAIEASGAPQALRGVINAVRRGRVLVQVGNLPAGEVTAALGNIVTREIDYRGSYRFVDEITDALTLMAGGIDVTPLMTHQLPMEDALQAFQLAADPSTGSSKVMLQLS